jgi:hypothetical protein
MNRCPCCDDTLLQEFRNHELILFCRSCWQEMPDFSAFMNRVESVSLQSNLTSISEHTPRIKGELLLLRYSKAA